MIRGYLYAIIALVGFALLTATYAAGRIDGRKVCVAEYSKQRAKEAEKAAQERKAIQDALDAYRAEAQRRQQEGADAIAQIRVEYLPGKIEVRREVVEKRVFTDCRIGNGMRDTLNAALRGAPKPAVSAGEAGLSL